MGTPILELNSVPLVLTPFNKADGILIRRVDNKDTVERFSLGQQTLADIEGFLPLRWPNLSLGLGRFRIDSDSAHILDEMRRFFDSTNDTRWADACGYLPILEEDSTHTGLEVVRASVPFKSDLWALWEDGSGRVVVSRKYVGSTTTWTAGGTIVITPTFDAASSSSVASGTSLTFAHTVANQPNRVTLASTHLFGLWQIQAPVVIILLSALHHRIILSQAERASIM
jgi:hypothetical protein